MRPRLAFGGVLLALGLGALLIAITTTGCIREDHPAPKRQSRANPASRGFIDSPVPDSRVGLKFVVAGWAVDESRVELIRIYLDDELVSTAPLTVMRPDIETAFPSLAARGRPNGFQALIDAGTRSGYCSVRLEALDGRGALTQFGSTSVRIEP